MNTTTTDFLTDFPTSIDGIIASLKDTIKSRQEGIEYRAMNYYNCVDDYSSGGICDTAAYEAIRSCQGAIEILQKQAERGTPFMEDFTVDVLTDMQGNVVSERIVQGRFGSCWIIGNGDSVQFVSTAKKMATYNKKGYKVMQRVFTVEYYYTNRLNKNGDLITRGRLLNQSIIEWPDNTDLWVSTRMNRVLYNTINN
jgi:hypothetical protein